MRWILRFNRLSDGLNWLLVALADLPAALSPAGQAVAVAKVRLAAELVTAILRARVTSSAGKNLY